MLVVCHRCGYKTGSPEGMISLGHGQWECDGRCRNHQRGDNQLNYTQFFEDNEEDAEDDDFFVADNYIPTSKGCWTTSSQDSNRQSGVLAMETVNSNASYEEIKCSLMPPTSGSVGSLPNRKPIATTKLFDVEAIEKPTHNELDTVNKNRVIHWFKSLKPVKLKIIRVTNLKKLGQNKEDEDDQSKKYKSPGQSARGSDQFLKQLYVNNQKPFDLSKSDVNIVGSSKGHSAQGFQPKNAELTKFKGISRKGGRAAQMLMHFSRLCFAAYDTKYRQHHDDNYDITKQNLEQQDEAAALKKAKKSRKSPYEKPITPKEVTTARIKYQLNQLMHSITEVQFGYISDGTNIQLFASANDDDVAEEIAKLLEKPSELIQHCFQVDKLRRTLPKGQGTRAADRISRWLERCARFSNNNREDKDDLRDANLLWELFRDRQITIVVNPNGRHAEQNIAWAMNDLYGEHDANNLLADIQGTRWRCMACTAELGTGHTHKGKPFSGPLWEQQAHLKLSLARVLAIQDKSAYLSATTFAQDSSESEEDDSGERKMEME